MVFAEVFWRVLIYAIQFFMKKYFLLINLIACAVIVFLFWIHISELNRISADYKMEETLIDDLNKQFHDSTSRLRYYYNKKELMNYARKVDDDSLRNFILRQADLSSYYIRYENDLRGNLSIINYALVEKRKNYFILFSTALLLGLVNISFGFIIFRKAGK